ncbi:MAG: hypothetical protein COT91_05060 [Candidatus Doudnabacteria bacterium CG10_big_fil_rev_8_21_14_0_10_41_10]|uniref:Uncharacterized protein n=1 Tax=Candidatus Doudnabacteria bacterium CG10_big_fil_rev_8_21_14_0_10_41_10 TaxID=1974551 RepID=A0A2H0VCE5_9BACT|nr:MAG: hypothetical protein COT91_05060 [Candidatus Doudnabacteria bacterium CG10_big_fil_rev_8_21_14_0_10_41_10]
MRKIFSKDNLTFKGFTPLFFSVAIATVLIILALYSSNSFIYEINPAFAQLSPGECTDEYNGHSYLVQSSATSYQETSCYDVGVGVIGWECEYCRDIDQCFDTYEECWCDVTTSFGCALNGGVTKNKIDTTCNTIQQCYTKSSGCRNDRDCASNNPECQQNICDSYVVVGSSGEEVTIRSCVHDPDFTPPESCRVAPPPQSRGNIDIGVTLTPFSPQPINPGGTAQYLATVSSQGGFAGWVDLSVPGCPLSASCVISPNRTYLSRGDSDSADVTVSATGGLSPGNYTITARAAGRGESGSGSSQLSVNAGPVLPPACDDSAVGTNQFVSCVWDYPGGDANIIGLYGVDPGYILKGDGPTTVSQNPADSYSIDYPPDAASGWRWLWNGPAGESDSFIVRWRGNFNFTGGKYDFSFPDNQSVDDGAKVIIEDPVFGNREITPYASNDILNHCYAVACNPLTIPNVDISAGTRAVTVIFREHAGDARIKLNWSKTSSGLYTFTHDPSVLNYSATQGDANPALQQVIVTNTGDQILNFTASDNRSWISVSPVSFSLVPGANQAVAVSITDTSFAPSIYTGTVTLSEPNAGNQTVGINYVINFLPAPKPDVDVSISAVNGSSSFNLSKIKNGDVLRFNIVYGNNGPGDASRVSAGITLSSNLRNPTNFSCPGLCSGSLSGFTYTGVLTPNDSFGITFEAVVSTQTSQARELATVDTSGVYSPGLVAFSARMVLLASTDNSQVPDFHEVPPE